MNGGTRLAIAVIGAALALGLAGDALFHGRPLGLNVALWAAAFVAALGGLLRLGRVPLHQGRRLMVAPLLVFAAFFAWHDSPLLIAVNLLALATAVTLGRDRRSARPALRRPVRRSGRRLQGPDHRRAAELRPPARARRARPRLELGRGRPAPRPARSPRGAPARPGGGTDVEALQPRRRPDR